MSVRMEFPSIIGTPWGSHGSKKKRIKIESTVRMAVGRETNDVPGNGNSPYTNRNEFPLATVMLHNPAFCIRHKFVKV